MADLAQTRQAIARVNTGKNVIEDSWMTMWCSTNWGDLLQPAPLSIALLGSIMVIAASTDDFSLVNLDDPEPYKWKYAVFPGSFKACLMQMVNEGYSAFGTAHKSMTRIQNASSQLPDVIKTAVYTIIKASPAEVKAYLPDQIQSALDLANICVSAAQESETAFLGIQNLARELVIACTNQVGTAEQKLAANKTQLGILEEQKKSDEEQVRFAKETNTQMMNSLRTAEGDFHTAIEKLPSGWSLVGMQVVEGLTHVVSSATNALVGVATLKPLTDLGRAKHASPRSETSKSSGPSPSRKALKYSAPISDPAMLEVHNVLQLSKALQQLLFGGHDGSPDWDKIRGDGSNKSQTGAIYVNGRLEVIKKRLDLSKPISAQLLPVIDDALNISRGITQVATSVRASEDSSLNEYKQKTQVLITNVERIVTHTNLILQQPGTVPSGPATPPTPLKASGSAARMAVENARFGIDQTRANLEVAREAYNQATAKLLEQQKQIGETIAHLTSLSLTNAGIKAMLPVLKKAIGAFTTMQAQFSQISQFFTSVASLLSEVLQPSVTRWAQTMGSDATLGGVKVGDFARQLIYTQMMVPLKVSMLSEKIATVYLEVSDKHIMPAQRSVGGMMEFTDDPSEEGRKVLRASLQKKQLQLQQQSKAASDYISDLVARDQKKLTSSIDQRLASIQNTLQDVFPDIAEPVPAQIQEVTSDYVKQFVEMRDNAADQNPIYDLDDLI